MQRWSVYLVRCSDDTLYCGVAVDVAARMAAHAAGKGARYTRRRGPFEILLTRRCRDRGTALRLEYAIKQLPREEKLALVGTAGRGRVAAIARAISRRVDAPPPSADRGSRSRGRRAPGTAGPSDR